MAKPTKITINGTPWRWRWRSLKNWFYDKWMRVRGYTPTTFRLYNNTYNYEKRSEIDKALTMQEKEPVHEIVGYMAEETEVPWYHSPESKRKLETARGHKKALNSLRTGEKDVSLIRRSLPRE